MGTDVRVSVVFDDINGFKMDIADDTFGKPFSMRGAEYGCAGGQEDGVGFERVDESDEELVEDTQFWDCAVDEFSV